ncbi:hypothetical protein DFH08DRAFT_967565 [Mycena albidolilacea]|uniref:Uncharacterized protein n=1 Tax=Mycena albidolilacea TaxID=1033008 RepID=A0AAD6ZM25_9AGAR|nr:hypothetical protein DFH08DRAFT_967565 [Mycena albidolilacea]
MCDVPAHHLTKKYDPEGVLTKPDRIPRGDENWLPLIKKPSKITGTASSSQALRISSKTELENTVEKTRALLAQLPKPPSSDPIGEIASLLHGFVGELHKILEGVPRADGLLQVIPPAQEPYERPEEGLDDFPFPDPIKSSGVHSPFGRYPFVVQQSFIAEFISKWASPAIILCCFVHQTLAQHIKALIAIHFSAFGQGSLEQRVTILVQDYMKQRADTAQALILKLIALKEDGPLMLNEHYLADYKTKFLSDYKSTREKAQNPVLANAIEDHRLVSSPAAYPDIAQVLAGLAAVGLNGIDAEDLVKLLPPDRMDPALNIMADVRAYFQERIADNIPLAIDHELVRGAGRDLLPTLYRGLGINGRRGCVFAANWRISHPRLFALYSELQLINFD